MPLYCRSQSRVYLLVARCACASQSWELSCGTLQVVYFVNSGSEANDMALMLARAYTGNYDIIALRNGYHGMSAETMGLCGQHTWKQPMPQGFGVHHAMNPDPYRGAFSNDGER